MTELLSMDEPRRRIAAMLSGLDIHYDLGEGHPLLGRRMPDLDLHTADGPTRVFTLLHDARPVLLNLGEPGGFDISPRANRVRLVDAKHDGVWELPVLGEIDAPPAVLIRPDGHVAWAGDLTDPELPQALATWFGAATPAHQNPTSERHHAHHLCAVGDARAIAGSLAVLSTRSRGRWTHRTTRSATLSYTGPQWSRQPGAENVLAVTHGAYEAITPHGWKGRYGSGARA
jgi:hypothetical protein